MGRNDAGVDVQRARAPHPLELLFLEGAQDLGLQPERQVADLVQKERSQMRHLEPPQLPPDGPVKAPFS